MAMDESTMPPDTDPEADTGPVLVRPYVDEYTNPPPAYEPDEEEWDDTPASQPAQRARHLYGVGRLSRHRGREREVPVGRHVFRRFSRRSIALLAAGTVVMIIALVAGVVAATTRGGATAPGSAVGGQAVGVDTRRPAGPIGLGGSARSDGHSPSATTPRTASPGTTQPGGSTQTGTATLTPGLVPTDGTGNPPVGPGPTSPGGSTPGSSPDPTSPPPAADLTGQITNAAGLCLSTSDEDRVRLWDCDGSAREAWTLRADGTIRVQGQCLRPGTAMVRLDNCDGSLAQQWRIGSAQSLVNVASGNCLGDPSSGTTKGTPQRTATCDGSDAQRWNVPA